MNLEHFARLFRLQYQPQPRELPPQPYFPNGIGYGAHRVPHSELPPMGGLPDNMGALGGFYRHIRIGGLDDSYGFLPLLDGVLVWLEYEELADAPEGRSVGVDSKTHGLAPTQGWLPGWVIFARLIDDSVLFADTAEPECPVFWLPTGYGTLDKRVPVAPGLASFMETLAALRELETAYENSGRAIFCDDGYGFAEAWSQEARAVVEQYLPEHAAGFCAALDVC
ncbi:hypothetical protein [Neisseria bacilliformis]|uniref:hypothetical protein n=1 Tax=Neisseria bacilliformis TaxID=267212 RepID=UPI0028E7BF30|nr:hypothetical protein [Neisseria bacilliformis]